MGLNKLFYSEVFLIRKWPFRGCLYKRHVTKQEVFLLAFLQQIAVLQSMWQSKLYIIFEFCRLYKQVANFCAKLPNLSNNFTISNPQQK